MQTYTASLIADYFRSLTNPEYGDLLSNLKLQKLCYYAAGIIAAVRGNDDHPLFQDDIEAWQHGPVVPSVYQLFKEFGAAEIPHIEGVSFDQIDTKDRAILDDVYNFYGQYSAWKLRNMTHEEAPWKDAISSGDQEISTKALRVYFADEVGPDYVRSYHEAQ